MRERRQALVCFAGNDWWYNNRGLFCPQIMRRLARDYRVLFVNSLGMRVPSFRKDKHALKKILRKLRSICRFMRRTEDGMFVLSAISLPLLGSALGRKFNTCFVAAQVKSVMWLLRMKRPVFYVNCLPALNVIRNWPRRLLIYERTDLFEEMPGVDKQYVAGLDRELTKNADLVLYVNRQLCEQGLEVNENSLLVGHGVDVDLFRGAAANPEMPADMAEIRRPIVGFFGDISDKTSDFTLLEFTARKLPDVSFVLVGPIGANVAGLRRCPNVHLLGPRPYRQIPHYGAAFDVAMMPWNQNRWIEFCNPIKLKEYLALGKPVVTTYYPEIEPYKDVVYVARSYEEFVAGIQAAREEDDSEQVRRRQEKVRDKTWDSKVSQIRDFIEEHASRD
jgi:glycosyltransferase involved in cell wall biosynthesis